MRETVHLLRVYIVPLLMQRQDSACANCAATGVPFDVDHKVYNPMISIDHLQLLCVPCHKAKTDFRPFRNRKLPTSPIEPSLCIK
jgi:5-methylcytosine-specific restriction endonuclease McrA